MIAAKSARAGAAVRSGVQMTRTNWCKCSVSRRRGCGQKFLFTWRRGCNYHDKIGSEPTEGGRSCEGAAAGGGCVSRPRCCVTARVPGTLAPSCTALHGAVLTDAARPFQGSLFPPRFLFLRGVFCRGPAPALPGDPHQGVKQ